jgi:IS4 transposase
MILRPPPKKPDPVERLLQHASFNTIPSCIITHCQAAPLGVMVRGLMEWFLDAPSLEKLFRENAPDQYTRKLTITALVGLMTQVSAGLRPSVFSAYKADRAASIPTISSTYQAVYGKLGRMNPEATAALVRFSAERLQSLTNLLPEAGEGIAGYRLRILDGNVLTGTDHRLKPLRSLLNACLPGKSLVVYEPGSGLVTDLVLCEDAYSQERALLVDLLPRVGAKDLIVADRNFCTTRFVFGVVTQQGFFLVREHASNVPWEAVSKLKKCGTTATGDVYEQTVRVSDPQTKETMDVRRIEVRLFEETRDGEEMLALLTNVPCDLSAIELTETYRRRWTIETHFQFLTQSLHCEVAGLGKPRAALFMFAMALVAGNALAVVRASLRQAHGREAEAEVSGYYLANEMAASFRAVNMYAASLDWTPWRHFSPQSLVQLLTAIATNVNMVLLTRTKRGPKKPPAEKPTYDKKHTHFSTARILDNSC